MNLSPQKKFCQVARWIFYILTVCSYLILVIDPLRRIAWIAALVGSIGSMIAFGLQQRALKKSGGAR